MLFRLTGDDTQIYLTKDTRRRSTATAAGSSRTRPVGPNAGLADRMLVKAAETLPEGARPLAHSDRGCHCQWPGWLALMDHYGPALSTGAKGCSPDNAAAEGLSGRMKTESVHPGHWEERTRDEVLVPVDGCIRWYDHERIKRSLGWMSPVQYRQSQGMAARSSPRKRPQPRICVMYGRFGFLT